MIKNGLHVKYPLYLSFLMKLEFSQQIFRKTPKHKIPRKSVQLLHADRRTDRHDEANIRFSQFCERA